MREFLKYLSLLMVLVASVGCAPTDREKAEKEASRVLLLSWDGAIPADELIGAKIDCRNGKADCLKLAARLQILSDGIASCKNASQFCTAWSDLAKDRPLIFKELPPAKNVIEMPIHPFYVDFGNEFLDTQAQRFSYRAEVASWWFEKHRLAIFIVSTCFVALLALLGQKILEMRAEKTRQAALKAAADAEAAEAKKAAYRAELAAVEALKAAQQKQREVENFELAARNVEELVAQAAQANLAEKENEKIILEKLASEEKAKQTKEAILAALSKRNRKPSR